MNPRFITRGIAYGLPQEPHCNAPFRTLPASNWTPPRIDTSSLPDRYQLTACDWSFSKYARPLPRPRLSPPSKNDRTARSPFLSVIGLLQEYILLPSCNCFRETMGQARAGQWYAFSLLKLLSPNESAADDQP
eukprot:509781-Pyramimonas_sp.AAC.1